MKAVILLCIISIATASPSITVDSDGKYKHGEYVTVHWTEVESKDRDSCWLGLFFHGANLAYAGKAPFPATPPFLESAPIKFVACSSPNFTDTGNGSRSVRLLAYRVPLEVALFAGGYGSDSVPRLLARSQAPLVASDGGDPRFPRLAHTEGRDEMRLTWSSMNSSSSLAELSVSKDVLAPVQIVPSTVSTYTAASLCESPANSTGFADPGFHHTVVFKALKPGEYLYRVGGLQGGFRISDSKSIRIGVIADVGATEPDGMHYHWEEPMASTTYNSTLRRNQDVVLHLGDLSYATGYEAKWDLFLDQMTPISGRVPYMTALGNHEQDRVAGHGAEPHALAGHDSGGECAIPTYTRFPMPVQKDQASGWYRFSQGPVAFVIINSEWNVTAGSLQHSFLRLALASIDRLATPWVVVGCHRPIYTGNKEDGADSMLGRDDVEDLLKEYEVDFMLYGHIHNAQRTCPIYRGKCTNATRPGGFPGTVHAVIGNGGQGLTPFPTARAPWSLFQDHGFGFNELEVNLTTAVLRFFGDNDTLLDETTYVRPFPRQTPEELVV